MITDDRYFIVVDSIALVIQAIGGGLASTATHTAGDRKGAHIMLAGIILQLRMSIWYCLGL